MRNSRKVEKLEIELINAKGLLRTEKKICGLLLLSQFDGMNSQGDSQ